MLLSLTPPSEETEEAIDAFAVAVKGMDVGRLLILVSLFVACLIVMKVLLGLLDRTFRRLEVENSLHVFVRAALRVVL